MRLSVGLAGKAHYHVGLVLVFMVTCSCRSALDKYIAPAEPVRLTVSKATTNSIDSRFRTALADKGKKSFTLDDCKRIALAENLELQVARLEEISKAAIHDGSEKKILPHLIVDAELGDRNNLGFSYSDVIDQEGRPPGPGLGDPPDATGVTNYSVGHERTTFRYNFQLRWSPTDAALAYYLSKSGQNDCLRAKYQRIRVAQKLLGTIEATFFRLLTLQKLLPMANRLKTLRNSALRETEYLFEEKMKSIEDYHQTKQDFLKSSRIQLIVQDNFERQRNILATAMRLSPEFNVGCGFYVKGHISVPVFRDCIQRMEMQGVKNRPEALEAGLNYLNSVNDVRRTFIKYFPKVTGYYKYTRDKDKFLFNKDWNEVGVRTYFDFTEWVTNWDESRAAKSLAVKAEAEMGAVALGIASQVRVAALNYFRAMRQLSNAEASTKISRRVFRTAKVRAGRDDISRIQLLEVEASTLQEEIDRTRALGEVNATLAELRAEMGINYKEPPYGN